MHGYGLWILAFPASREFDARSGLPGCPALQDMCTISIPVILASQRKTCRFALTIAIGAECILRLRAVWGREFWKLSCPGASIQGVGKRCARNPEQDLRIRWGSDNPAGFQSLSA